MGRESFGACLSEFMDHNPSQHVCHPKHLAAAIRCDVGQVNRWRRHVGAPKLNSGRIAAIADHLRLPDEQMKELEAAAIYTLKQPPLKPPKRSKAPPITSSETSPFSSLIERGPLPQKRAVPVAPPAPAPRHSGGRLAEEIIKLLEKIPEGSGTDEPDNTILLTWQGRDTIEMNEEQQERWRLALRTVLRRGWRIDYLCRLDKNLHRTARLVEMMLNYLGAGAYRPFYFTSYGTLSIPHDVLVAPGVGAAWMFSAYSEHRVDAGFLTSRPDRIQEISAYARQLMTQTTPLVSAYFSEDDSEYMSSLSAAENHPGGRRVVKNGLSVNTYPEAWFDGVSQSPFVAPSSGRLWESHAAHIENRQLSIAAFKRYVERYDYREICTEDAIDLLIERGQYRHDAPLNQLRPERTLRLQHLKHVVELLETQKRFHMAIVDRRKTPAHSRIVVDSTWVVTPDNTVFLETWVPDRSGQPVSVNLHITERMVADGFREHFDQMWNRIPPSERERERIIHWLRSKIEALEDDMARAGE